MTALPAPASAVAVIIEEEALAYAQEMLNRYHGGGNPWSPASPLTAEAGRATMRHLYRQAALLHPITRMNVIVAARNGDTAARDVLNTLIIEMKSDRRALPTELENYTMEVLAGGLHQPPGPRRKDKLLRDLVIALVVAAVCDRYQLAPTRNTASRGRPAARRSACSIVAEALGGVRVPLGEKAVEAVWARLGIAMPTVRGWASSS